MTERPMTMIERQFAEEAAHDCSKQKVVFHIGKLNGEDSPWDETEVICYECLQKLCNTTIPPKTKGVSAHVKREYEERFYERHRRSELRTYSPPPHVDDNGSSSRR